MAPMFHFACCCSPADVNYGLFMYNTSQTYNPLKALHFSDGVSCDTRPDTGSSNPLFGRPVIDGGGGFHQLMKTGSSLYHLRMLPAQFGTENYVWEHVGYTNDSSKQPVRSSLTWTPGGLVGFLTYSYKIRVVDTATWNTADLDAPSGYSGSSSKMNNLIYGGSSGFGDWSAVGIYLWREGTSPNYKYYKETWLYTGDGLSVTSTGVLAAQHEITYTQFSNNIGVHDSYSTYRRQASGDIWVYASRYEQSDIVFSKYSSGGNIVNSPITSFGIPSGSTQIPGWLRYVEDNEGSLYILYRRTTSTGTDCNTLAWSARKLDDATNTFGEDILADYSLTYNLGKGVNSDPNVWPNGEVQNATECYLGFDSDNNPVITYAYRLKNPDYYTWTMELRQIQPASDYINTVVGSDETAGNYAYPFYWLCGSPW